MGNLEHHQLGHHPRRAGGREYRKIVLIKCWIMPVVECVIKQQEARSKNSPCLSKSAYALTFLTETERERES